MNSTGRPRMPLPLFSLANSSHARLAWIPYCALLPDSAAGRPILMGLCACARRRKAGPPTVAAAPPTTAVVKKSRRFMVSSLGTLEPADYSRIRRRRRRDGASDRLCGPARSRCGAAGLERAGRLRQHRHGADPQRQARRVHDRHLIQDTLMTIPMGLARHKVDDFEWITRTQVADSFLFVKPRPPALKERCVLSRRWAPPILLETWGGGRNSMTKLPFAAAALLMVMATSSVFAEDPIITVDWGLITQVRTGWVEDSMAVFTEAKIPTNTGCPTTDAGYVTNPNDAGHKLHHAALLGAYFSAKHVQVVLQGCVYLKPRIIGVYVKD